MTRALVFVLALVDCSSQYVPRARGHIAPTIQEGKVVYIRDGRVYEHGIFGSGLVDAVAGNAAATRAATEFHDRVVTGIITVVVGLVAMSAGTGWAVQQATSGNDRNTAAPLLVASGGLLLTLIGALYAATAEPYRWDAINLFNDATDDATISPSWHAAASLRMRD